MTTGGLNNQNEQNMKKLALAGSALLVVAALSCTRELDIVTPVNQEYVFEAVWADGAGTRTALQEDGTSVWWTTGEEINVFYGCIASGKFVSTNTEPAALTSFSGSLPVVTGTVESGHSASSFWGVYPYDAATTCDGESVTLNVPSKQSARDGSFADKFFPAVAVSRDFALAFYNVCGGASFCVANTGINAVTFHAVGGENLVGKVKVGFGSDGKPVIQQVSEGGADVTVNAPAGGFVPGKYYFAAFLPGTLSQGIKVTYRKANQSASCTMPNPLTINRSRFGVIDRKDKGLTFVNGGGAGNALPVPEAVDLGLSVKWASFNVGASKPEEYGHFYAWGEIEPKNEYSEKNYKWGYGDWVSFIETKYGRVDDKYVLDPEDDVAFMSFGGKWRMPTTAEMEELMEYCTWEWRTINGVRGAKATGPNGKSIFIPHQSVEESYWSANHGDNKDPYGSTMRFTREDGCPVGYSADQAIALGFDFRYYGHLVRPVCGDVAKPIKKVAFVNSSQEIKVGESMLLELVIEPENTTHKNLLWSSNNESVVTITQTGFVTGVSSGTAIISLSSVYGGKTALCEISVAPALSSMMKPDAIDLGLSVKWASFNLGAMRPEEYGYYYSWGETVPKQDYSAEYYKWYGGLDDNWGYLLTKYVMNGSMGDNGFQDGKINLDSEDDAAYVNLGGLWRMPTKQEMEELVEKCTWEWIKLNGVEGARVIGPNGNSIFLPAAEEWSVKRIVPFSSGDTVLIWSSSQSHVHDDYWDATALGIIHHDNYDYWSVSDHGRSNGICIRPVKPYI